MDVSKALFLVICKVGNGRLVVLLIFASYSASWNWLSAEAPEASKKIAATGSSCPNETPCRNTMEAASPENATASETL
jgi:hypothetical protein